LLAKTVFAVLGLISGISQNGGGEEHLEAKPLRRKKHAKSMK
jgi:hypothetical protein